MNPSHSAVFELQGVHHRFKTDASLSLEVLRGINLQVERRQCVAILGPSGSGKSTLLSILAGLQPPSTGHVFWNQQPIEGISERNLAPLRSKTVALIFQQFLLIPHLTALENVSLPLELQGRSLDSARESARKILTDLGLKERLNHFPRMLSGGECQRVAIARAISVEPLLLLADEPTGNLDSKASRSIFDLLLSLPQSGQVGCLVVVTHNEELAQRCDRRIRLVDGQLLEEQ